MLFRQKADCYLHPAIITGVHSREEVNLMVFFDGDRPDAAIRVCHADYAEPGKPSWEWPRLVKAPGESTVGSVLNEKLAADLVAENDRLRDELARASRITLAVAAPDIEHLAEGAYKRLVESYPVLDGGRSYLTWAELAENVRESYRIDARRTMEALQALLAEKV